MLHNAIVNGCLDVPPLFFASLRSLNLLPIGVVNDLGSQCALERDESTQEGAGSHRIHAFFIYFSSFVVVEDISRPTYFKNPIFLPLLALVCLCQDMAGALFYI